MFENVDKTEYDSLRMKFKRERQAADKSPLTAKKEESKARQQYRVAKRQKMSPLREKNATSIQETSIESGNLQIRVAPEHFTRIQKNSKKCKRWREK